MWGFFLIEWVQGCVSVSVGAGVELWERRWGGRVFAFFGPEKNRVAKVTDRYS